MIQATQFLVAPTGCYETLDRTIIEACAYNVIASKVGAFTEIVEDGRTGLRFAPGKASDLREKIRLKLHEPNVPAMRHQAGLNLLPSRRKDGTTSS